MATPEERFALLGQQLAVMTQQNRELADAIRQAQANGPGPARAAPPNGLGVDTRLLGKPPNFDGAEAKWTDWSVVTRAYCAITHPQLGALMAQVESTAVDIPLGGLDGANADACRQLYYILLMLCQGTALNIIVNAGELQGCIAWRRLHQRYEPKAKTRFAGQMLELLSWSFDGDLQGRLELFERHLARFENDSKEKMSDPIKIGIVLRQLTEGPLKQHLLMQSERLQLWPDFRDEIVNIRRAQASLHMPMDIGALNKGGKGGKGASSSTVCWTCGKTGHRASDCRGGGGAGRGKGKARGGKGKGKGKGGGNGSTQVCSHCHRTGHTVANCWTKAGGKKGGKGVNALDANAAEPEQTAVPGVDSLAMEGLFIIAFCVDEKSASLPLERSPPEKRAAPHLNSFGQSDRLTMGVDSGAAVTVIPRWSCGAYPVVKGDRAGVTYRTATNQAVKDEGLRELIGRPNGQGEVMGIRARVADVHKALLSVAEVVDKGFRVVFDTDQDGRDTSHMVRKSTGQRVEFRRRNKVYEIDWDILPYQPGPEDKASFSRPAGQP